MKGLAEKLEWNTISISFILPELVLACGIVFLTLFVILNKRKDFFIWLFGLFVVLSSCILILLNIYQVVKPVVLFAGSLVFHTPALVFCLLCDVALIIGFVIGYKQIKKHNLEYTILLLMVLLGAHLLCKAGNWVTVILGIELMSLPAYLVIAISKEKRNIEAAVKYFIFGATATAIMLFGISWLYGITGTLNFYGAYFAEQMQVNQHATLFVAIAFISVGLLYKINAAPVHAWAPDVYEGAPTSVIAILSVIPKIAATASLFFIFGNIQTPYGIRWPVLLAYIALLTILTGNFGAIRQTNAKRMMAYSSVAQSGFLLISILGFGTENLVTIITYSIVFILANYLVFILLIVAENNKIELLSQFKGLGKSNALILVLGSIGLLALAGLPPTLGFTGKLVVFSQLWEQYQIKPSALWLNLLVVGLLSTVVALYFYLRIPYFAFIKESQQKPPTRVPTNLLLTAIVLALMLVLLFFFPSLLMGWLNTFTFALR
jgi:NADH-quinone oxidoreductase subunit N